MGGNTARAIGGDANGLDFAATAEAGRGMHVSTPNVGNVNAQSVGQGMVDGSTDATEAQAKVQRASEADAQASQTYEQARFKAGNVKAEGARVVNNPTGSAQAFAQGRVETAGNAAVEQELGTGLGVGAVGLTGVTLGQTGVDIGNPDAIEREVRIQSSSASFNANTPSRYSLAISSFNDL